jgi:L-2-hydroxyglutarate oxidase LhgO
MSEQGFDIVVIGAGVVGLSVAHRLASSGRSVLILERETGIAQGVTSRNSEVVHAGIYYPKGSLKAVLCVDGRERLYTWCASHRVEHRRLGKLIVATRSEEISVLEDLRARGQANGVERLDLIDAAQVASLEPNVAAVGGLLSPDTGIVDAHGFCLSLLAAAEAKGAVLAARRRVTALSRSPGGWNVTVAVGEEARCESIGASVVIDAAGLEADRVATLAGIDIDARGWRQFPCKGDYFRLAPGSSRRGLALARLIYPVPQTAGLGIHATLDLAGEMRFGPDTEYVAGVEDFGVDAKKGDVFLRAASTYLPALEGASLVPDYAGIRPKLAGPGDGFRDFVVEECSEAGAPGFVACIGIESPGLTAALAIAERVAEMLR